MSTINELRLSYIPLDQINVGDRVRSEITENTGTVTIALNTEQEFGSYGDIKIEWDNGNISRGPYYDEDFERDNQFFHHVIRTEKKAKASG
jgi:hypothetical protein